MLCSRGLNAHSIVHSGVECASTIFSHQTVLVARDVRAAVDLCHRDGSLKQAVAKDPAKYIHEDKRLVGIMDMYRAAGKKLFVATNSLWDYTHVVMNFLLSGRVGSEKNEDWLEYFDVVITGDSPHCYISRLHLSQACCINRPYTDELRWKAEGALHTPSW